MQRNVYYGTLNLLGEDDENTIREASNYTAYLNDLKRFEQAKSVLRKVVPTARRLLGESSDLTLRMRKMYAKALYKDNRATLDDLREAVTTLEGTERTARRVLGGAHPLTLGVETSLRSARTALAARDGDDASSVCEALRKAKV